MIQQENHAVDAIWKTDMENAQEKLVLYHLATKHELGDRYSSTWKSVDRFLEEFGPRWGTFKEMKLATQLTDVKLQRALEGLQKKGYIQSQTNPEPKHHGRNETLVYAITPKIFKEFSNSLQTKKKQA